MDEDQKDPLFIPLSFLEMTQAEYSDFKKNVDAMNINLDILESGLSDEDRAHISLLELKYQARKAAGKVAEVIE